MLVPAYIHVPATAYGDDATATQSGQTAAAVPAPPSSQPSTQPASPAATQPNGRKLSDLSIEDLMDIEVSSVSKQKQRLGDAAASVTVIGQDEIRRAGMTSIPELLRLAPGLQVSQQDTGIWVVGSRGFASQFTNNLLVMMDGRTVYTPLFGGVFWNAVDYPLNDLQRIEVVRGPGGTLWGSNAVNGVINILTKSAEETQGLSLQDYTGADGYLGSVRYGGNVDNRLFYRVYSQYRAMDAMPDPANPKAGDSWTGLRNGFRVDDHLSPVDLLTVQGDVFENHAGNPRVHPSLTAPYAPEFSDLDNTDGGNLLARFTHTISPSSDFTLELYFDNLHLNNFNNDFDQNTGDIEFQHRFGWGAQEIVWGAGYRFVADNVHPMGPVLPEGDYVNPERRDNSWANVFVQDDITLVPQRLHAIVGTKLELTPYTGLEFQPSARLLFTPDEKNTLWAAVSRAVREPGRSDEDGHVLVSVVPTQTVPLAVAFVGNQHLQAEELLAFESGYRTEPLDNVSLDISGFLNVHRHVVEGLSMGAPTLDPSPTPHLDLPVTQMNAARGLSYGAEAQIRWKPDDRWSLSAAYSFIGIRLHSTVPGDDLGTLALLDGGPAHQAQVHASYDVTKDIQINAATYFVDTMEVPHLGSYFRSDLNVSWRVNAHLDVMLGVRNLFDAQHPEFTNTEIRSTTSEVPRTFFVTLSGTF